MNRTHAVQEALGCLHAEIVALPGLEVEAMRHLSGFLEKHGFSVRRAAGDIPGIELQSRVKATPIDAPRLGAWKTMREVPHSFGNATWVE